MLGWAVRLFRCAQLRSTQGKRKEKRNKNQKNTGCQKSKCVLEHQRKKKICVFSFALLTLTNSNAQVKQAKACFSTILNAKITSVLSLELSNDVQPLVKSWWYFPTSLHPLLLLWFHSVLESQCNFVIFLHAPHLLCFSQTDAMVLLSFHTRSLTQANSRPLGKFKTGQGTMNHASQRKKHLNMAHQVKPSLKHWADPWRRSVEYSQRIKNVPTNSTKRDTNVKFKNKHRDTGCPQLTFGRSGG